jgi:hypothetical protein
MVEMIFTDNSLALFVRKRKIKFKMPLLKHQKYVKEKNSTRNSERPKKLC